jgi:hypothetical protein
MLYSAVNGAFVVSNSALNSTLLYSANYTTNTRNCAVHERLDAYSAALVHAAHCAAPELDQSVGLADGQHARESLNVLHIREHIQLEVVPLPPCRQYRVGQF